MSAEQIQAIDLSSIDLIKSLFEAHIDRDALEAYRLPVINNQARVVVGMSGGADSTVLGLFVAAYLMPHYPNVEFMFTDTGAEPDSCHETLDAVEKMAGISITRIKPENDIFALIEKYKGFLPNSLSRWCTSFSLTH